jgi:hypothetical protein
MRQLLAPLVAAMLLGLAACTENNTTYVVPPPAPVPVEVEIEVYDPVTNGVWENVGVRVVSAWNEWSDCECASPTVQYLLSDSFGLVYFSPYYLAAAEVGFAEDANGRAVLGADPAVDDAVVRLEVWADGFTPVIVDVPLNWSAPYGFVSVPFEAPPGL